MTPQPPHDFFAPQRSAYLDDALERSYARRRIATVIVLIAALGAGAYALWGRGPASPADIPTVKAEGPYKQKPAEPGGIDIPHQDVRVYDALENKGAQPQVEHLLPLPETPQNVPHTAPPAADIVLNSVAPAPASTTAGLEPAAPAPAPTTVTAKELPAPPPAPAPVTVSPPAPAPTTVAAKEPPAPASAPPEILTIEQVIKKTEALTPAPPPAEADSAPEAVSPVPAPAAATGAVAVQLASVPDQAKAQAMMQTLQQKYAAQLGDAALHLVRADLGARGVYYRIQSQGLAEDEAAHICAALKQTNAGCILVRK